MQFSAAAICAALFASAAAQGVTINLPAGFTMPPGIFLPSGISLAPAYTAAASAAGATAGAETRDSERKRSRIFGSPGAGATAAFGQTASFRPVNRRQSMTASFAPRPTRHFGPRRG
ncbi:hypothetical protein N658DRAFT_501629 [Parathielavia hyrcaniae]|uniref:Uncharacterized protein n=1 Tax=Parathielavia hyrcaniae TaxID=113614 RepID=A0AAN6SX96_9PEZI|nr:hypothetical protein N658DRAFT_501629 [Parathielavia hyrcaniae]